MTGPSTNPATAPIIQHAFLDMTLNGLPRPTNNVLPSHMALRSDGLLPQSATTRQMNSVLTQPLERTKTTKERRLGKSYSDSKRWIKISEGRVGRKASRESKWKVVRLYAGSIDQSPTDSKRHSRRHSRKPSQASSNYSRTSSKVVEQTRGFADDARVRKLFESRPLPVVTMDTAHKSDSSAPTTGESVQSTPVEMYEAQSSVPSHVVREKKASTETTLTPMDGGDGSLAVLAATPLAGGPITRIKKGVRLKTGSVVAVATPELTAWQRSEYVAGPIRLETSFFPPSASTLTDIDHVYHPRPPGNISHTRNASDDAVLDDVVDFFFEFGLVDFKRDPPPAKPKPLWTPLVSSRAGSFTMQRRRSSASLAWSTVRSENSFASATIGRPEFLPPLAPLSPMSLSTLSSSPSGSSTLPRSSTQGSSALPDGSNLLSSPGGRNSPQSLPLPSPRSAGRSSQKLGGKRSGSPKISLRRMIASASSIV
jgi:hypothetical protein